MSNDLVAKPGTKSIVWEHFGLRKGLDGKPTDDGRAKEMLPLYTVEKQGF